MEKAELILGRDYSKGDQLLALYVRVVTEGEIVGEVFRFETWKNNKEDESLREESGDIYFVQTKFFAKLLHLFENRWKRERTRDGEAKQYLSFFNPEVL